MHGGICKECQVFPPPCHSLAFSWQGRKGSRENWVNSLGEAGEGGEGTSELFSSRVSRLDKEGNGAEARSEAGRRPEKSTAGVRECRSRHHNKFQLCRNDASPNNEADNFYPFPPLRRQTPGVVQEDKKDSRSFSVIS